jgi:nickel/cobalt transporter (NicO) family protein
LFYELIIGTLTISILHALIPSHWMPILVFEKKYKWTHRETYRVTIIAALLHALSTVFLGIMIGFLSLKLNTVLKEASTYVSGGVLILLGFIFIIRHHKHNHFHLHNEEQMKSLDPKKVISVLLLGMFLSPCLEIEGYFILAGNLGWKYIALVSILYTLISVFGILFWMAFAKKILSKVNAHKIEHNAGLISGIILILTGILSFWLN